MHKEQEQEVIILEEESRVVRNEQQSKEEESKGAKTEKLVNRMSKRSKSQMLRMSESARGRNASSLWIARMRSQTEKPHSIKAFKLPPLCSTSRCE